MDPTLIGLIGLGVLLVLIFLGVHISVSMAIVGFIGSLIIAGSLPALANLHIIPFGTTNDFNLGALALFVIMSEFIYNSGISNNAYTSARALIGNIKGGLAMATVGACGLFAATSGSSIASAIVMGKVAYPEMERNGYDPALASGSIAAGGSIGIMIPPSMPFIIIGIVTGTSIGKLFIAGILPGVTQIIFYWITIYIVCKLKPGLAPNYPGVPFKQKVQSVGLTWPIILIFVVVIGGIYAGVFTPTESAAIGALLALIIGLGLRKLSWFNIKGSFMHTIKVTGMFLFILAGAFILNNFLAISRIPFVASDFINGLGLNSYIVLGIILITYVILGCFFDIMAVLILTLPILFPTVIAAGFDPIWYGVLMCRVAEMGAITPPFGINLFALIGVINVRFGTMARGIIPFFIADWCHLALLVAFPAISLFLPSIMRG